MISVKLNWMVAASMAAMSFAVPTVRAQDANTPGIVRISDSRPRVSVQPASFHGHRPAAVSGGSGYCPTGDCPSGYCPNGYCQGGGGCFQESYCKKSPDYGYSPPAKYPLHRRGVAYNTYFPNQWYGLPGGGLAVGAYPMVYQATDTTQLGFTYQHVPFWQPNPNMLPQRPVPAQWHIVAPPYHANLFANQGVMGANYPVEYATPAPIQNGVPAPLENMNGAPTPVPMPVKTAPEASLPPSPREIQNSAESEHIRRAGF